MKAATWTFVCFLIVCGIQEFRQSSHVPASKISTQFLVSLVSALRYENLFQLAQPSQLNPPSHFVLNTLLETCTATLYVLLRVRNTQNVQCPVGGVPRGCGVRAGRGGAVAGRWQRRWGGVLSVF